MIGIDISDRSIKIAEVVGNIPSELRTVCWASLSEELIRGGIIQDPAAVAQALLDSFKKCSRAPRATSPVVASIPETHSFVRIIDVPDMKDSEMDEAVRWAVRQHIPFDLDLVYMDWQQLPVDRSGPRKRQVLVGAAQRSVVDPLLDALDGAGLRVAALELEAQAIVRSLLPVSASDVRGVLIIDFGGTQTNIIFFDEGIMKFTASVQYGGDNLTQKLVSDLQISPEIAVEKKTLVGLVAQQGEDARISSSLHAGVLELLSRVESMTREMAAQLQLENAIRVILLSGGAANLPGMREVVGEIFPAIPVQQGNPWTNLSFPANRPPLSPEDASHFVTALGLALRHEERMLF